MKPRQAETSSEADGPSRVVLESELIAERVSTFAGVGSVEVSRIFCETVDRERSAFGSVLIIEPPEWAIVADLAHKVERSFHPI